MLLYFNALTFIPQVSSSCVPTGCTNAQETPTLADQSKLKKKQQEPRELCKPKLRLVLFKILRFNEKKTAIQYLLS